MTDKFSDDKLPPFVPDAGLDKFEMIAAEQYVHQSFDGDFTAQVQEAEYLDRLANMDFAPRDKVVKGNKMFSTTPESDKQAISRASRGRGMSPILTYEVDVGNFYPPPEPKSKFGD